MRKIFAAVAALFFATAAYGQNSGNVAANAFAVGKGPAVSGFTSVLCAAGQLPVGQAGSPVCRTISGDVTFSALGVVTLNTVNAGVGAFGSATQCTVFTVNAKGLITAASQTTCTPAIGSVTGLGTGVAAALANNIGSAGAVVLFNGAGGTPSSLVLTNATGLPIAGISGLGANCGTFLATPSSANLRACLTDESGTGLAYFQGGDLGTPSAGVGTNITGLNASNLSSGTVAAARGGAGTVNGVLASNGAGAVSQGATTGLTDATTDTVWTPTDSSGAGLSFTVQTARYAKVGKLATVTFRLVFPVTASGAGVSISGLPVATSPNLSATNNVIGNCFGVGLASALLYALAPNSSTTITLINTASATILNSNMSNQTLMCNLTYVTT